MEPHIIERLRDDRDAPTFHRTAGAEEWLKKNWALREEAAAEIERLLNIVFERAVTQEPSP